MNAPKFIPFNRHAPIRMYRRNLPHWRPDGCTYFVTFRLKDSIPQSLVKAWRERDRLWCVAHGLDGELTEDELRDRYVAIPAVDRARYEGERARRLHIELDKCHGSCLLKLKVNQCQLEAPLMHHHGTRCYVGDYVIMPNHVHWLVCPREGEELEDILRSVKSYTARRLKGKREGVGAWQRENYDRIVRDREELTRIRHYIGGNPVKAKLKSGAYRCYRCDWLNA